MLSLPWRIRLATTCASSCNHIDSCVACVGFRMNQGFLLHEPGHDAPSKRRRRASVELGPGQPWLVCEAGRVIGYVEFFPECVNFEKPSKDDVKAMDSRRLPAHEARQAPTMYEVPVAAMVKDCGLFECAVAIRERQQHKRLRAIGDHDLRVCLEARIAGRDGQTLSDVIGRPIRLVWKVTAVPQILLEKMKMRLGDFAWPICQNEADACGFLLPAS